MSVGMMHVCGRALCQWERFMSVGTLHVCGNAACLWERCMSVGTLYVCGNTACLWERYMSVGTVHVCGNAVRIKFIAVPNGHKHFDLIGLYHPLDVVTNPKYKLFHFLTSTFFLQREKGTSYLAGWVLPSSALFMADSLPL